VDSTMLRPLKARGPLDRRGGPQGWSECGVEVSVPGIEYLSSGLYAFSWAIRNV
jgi:hypothetical protein